MAAEIILMLMGFVPLALAIRTSRRWLRVILALVACACFLFCLQASLFISDGMRAHGVVGLSGFRVMSAVVYSLSALASLALVFVPARGRDYKSTKRFPSGNEDLTPKS